MTEAKRSIRWARWGGRYAWVITVILLALIGADRNLLGRPSADSRSYHARVRAASEDISFVTGNWLSVEASVPQGALNLLQPNVMLSRRYLQLGSTRQASLLLVHCQDARDILGHFPPNCYGRLGWELVEEQSYKKDWEVDGKPIRATRYLFRSPGHDVPIEIVIDNFMVLPNGQTGRDMTEVDQAARDPVLKHFGAAQVQIISDHDMPEKDREEIFQTLIRELQPLLDSIMTSVVEE